MAQAGGRPRDVNSAHRHWSWRGKRGGGRFGLCGGCRWGMMWAGRHPRQHRCAHRRAGGDVDGGIDGEFDKSTESALLENQFVTEQVCCYC